MADSSTDLYENDRLADSPRFMNPGAPAFVASFHLTDDEGGWPVRVYGYESEAVCALIMAEYRDFPRRMLAVRRNEVVA
jgi:hypothetical protein